VADRVRQLHLQSSHKAGMNYLHLVYCC